MNGPEHYAEAVRLLESTLVDDMQWNPEKRETLPTGEKIVAVDDERCWIANTVAAAQVHATLALAAAAQSAQDDIARCPHGSTGICMACLTPFVDHYGRQLVEGVRR